MRLFELWFSQGMCPVVALPGHTVVLFLFFFFKESPWKMKVAQSCPTVCDPKSIVHGILWARILDWVAFPFSRGFSQPMDQTQVYRNAGRFFTIWATGEAQEYWSG